MERVFYKKHETAGLIIVKLITLGKDILFNWFIYLI